MVNARIEERIAVSADDDEGMFADQRREAIVQLFTESQAGTDPAVALAELRAAHTTVADDGTEQFDELAYTEALNVRLVEQQPVTEADLVALAGNRSQNVQEAILAANAGLAARIVMGEAAAAETDDDGNIRMQVRLSASEDIPQPVPAAAEPVAATFQCADGPTVTARIFGSDQLELDDGKSVRSLARTRSASGARYTGEDVGFWEKGDEAMLTIGESRYDCLKAGSN
jgi:membrane-bound inhibitor of C-type lysozyme